MRSFAGVVILVLSMVVSAVASVPAASAHDGGEGDADGHEHSQEAVGADGAGPEGGPVGSGLVVADEVRAYIDAPPFVALREELGDNPGLVRQLGYHYRFRGMTDYLDTDPAHVAMVMRERNHVPEAKRELGLELTAGEWQEFRRREQLGDSIVEVRRFLTGRAFDEVEEEIEGGLEDRPGERLSTGDLFSGVWLDQMDGGVLKIAVTDASQVKVGDLARLVRGGRPSFEVIEQELSADELYALKDRVLVELAAAGEDSSVGMAYTDAGVKVGVYPSNVNQDLSAFVALDPDNVVIGPVQAFEEAGGPGSGHSGSSIVAGLKITGTSPWRSTGYSCTWGLNGHTSLTYVVTAGHCLLGLSNGVQSGRAGVTAKQGGTTISASNAFAYARFRDNSGDWDMARIESSYADTNCYHTDYSHCQQLTKRLSLYGHSVGTTVCASLGESNDYECGQVTDTDRNNSWTNSSGNQETAGTLWNRIIVGGFSCISGDSGAGVKWGSTIHGLLTNCPSQQSGGTTVMAFVPAYYVKTRIGHSGFDFNCVRNSNGTWASCPIVYS